MLNDPIITVNVTLTTPETVTAFFQALNGSSQAELPTTLSTVNVMPSQPVAAQVPVPMPAPAVAPIPAQIPAVPVATMPIPAPVPAPAPIPAPVPTAAPTYSFDDLARAAAPLMDAGKTADLQALLRSFNVQALTQLPKEQYGAFAMGLRTLGARI